MVMRSVKRGLVATVAAQGVTAAALLAFDAVRKRDRPDRPFPITPPQDVPVPHGQMRIYTYGEDLFRDMLADIEAAQHRVFLETFIWKGDEVGRDFRDALIRAHERGVEVYLVWDTFANLVVPPSFFRALPPGIHVKRHPLVGRFPWLTPRQIGRDHRKLLVVDDRAAYLGGYNIGSAYASTWRDTHARITGEMVVELENAFVDYWNLRTMRGAPALPEPQRRTWSRDMRVQRNVPMNLVYPIRNMYLEAIDRAEERVYLTSAYLIPDEPFITALLAAVRRGVDVRVIVPRFSNHVVADWLSRTLYEQLLEGGVRLLRYEGAMVHAKTATIDGRWSTVGTANIDRLSLAGNYELNLEVLDEDVAAHMERVFLTDAANCTELTLQEWTARPMIARLSEGILSPWRPLF